MSGSPLDQRLWLEAEPICERRHQVGSCLLVRTPRTYSTRRGGWLWSFVCCACGWRREFIDYDQDDTDSRRERAREGVME